MSETVRATFGAEMWARGTRGLEGPWASQRPRIVNMRYAITGALVPRPKFTLLANLTAETDAVATMFPARYLTVATGAVTSGYIHADSGAVSFYTTTTTPVATGTGINANPQSTVSQIDDYTWLVDEYQIGLRGSTSITVTNHGTALEAAFEPGTNTITVQGTEVHQGRAFYWGRISDASGHQTVARRIWYSDAYDYGTLSSATQFFDVDGSVQGCQSVGSNLLIWTTDGDWYVLQGRGDPADGTLNSLGRNRVPFRLRYPVRQNYGLYFLTSDGTRVVRMSEGGIQDESVHGHIGFDAEGLTVLGDGVEGGPIPTAGAHAKTIFVANNGGSTNTIDAMHMWNNTWTEEVWGLDRELVRILGTDELNDLEYYFHHDETNWRVFTRPITVASPPVTGSYAEAVPGTVGLPQINDPDHPVRVQRVIIDARAWKGGSYDSPPTMTVQVEDGLGNVHTLGLGPSSRTFANLADGEDQPMRIVATPTDMMPYSRYCKVVAFNITGLTIERITVDYERSNSENF